MEWWRVAHVLRVVTHWPRVAHVLRVARRGMATCRTRAACSLFLISIYTPENSNMAEICYGGPVSCSGFMAGFIVFCKICFLEPVSWSLCRMRFHGRFHGWFHGLFAGRGFMAGFMVGVVAGLGQGTMLL